MLRFGQALLKRKLRSGLVTRARVGLMASHSNKATSGCLRPSRRHEVGSWEKLHNVASAVLSQRSTDQEDVSTAASRLLVKSAPVGFVTAWRVPHLNWATILARSS